MSYRTVSSKQIVGKIYRDLKVPEYVTFADIMEWIGECLEEMQHLEGFIPKKETFEFTDSRILIPDNVYFVDSVYYNDEKLPYGHSGSVEYTSPIYLSAKKEVLESTNTEITRYGSQIVNTTSKTDYYTINGNWIQLSFSEGEVDILYYTYPIDEEGYPLIPDDQFYKQAIFWYVFSNMLLGGFMHQTINFAYARKQYNYYRLRATANAKMLSPDQKSRFTKIWTSVISNINYNDPKQFIE